MPPSAGDRFGRLLVVRRTPGKRKHVDVVCDCGTTKTIRYWTLTSGQVRSCGCLMREAVTARNYRHGEAVGDKPSTEWLCWHSMKQRCENPKHKSFKDYGGRGITVCERWQTFENFLADMGRRPPGMQIDRENNDRGYEPGNCHWVTPKQNSNNRRPMRKRRPPEAAE